MSKFIIGQKVRSVLDEDFVAQIHTVIERGTGVLYDCTYFSGGEPRTVTLYDYEIKPFEKNTRLGFTKEK